MTRPIRLLLPHTLTAAQKSQSGLFVIRTTLDARVYIGATQHLGKACNEARHDLRAGIHGSKSLQAFATAHGLHRLRFEALALCPVDELPAAKQRALDQHQACDPAHGFNSLNPAGPAGQRMSPEARARLSAGKKGRPIAKRTPEHQEKIAAAHRGRKRSPEACANMRGPRKPRRPRAEEPPSPGPKLPENPD